MEDLAVFTALNHSGSFGKNFVKFKNKKYVIYSCFPCEENEENTYKYGNNTRTRKEEMCDKTEEP